MPFALKPACTECKATNSSLWRKLKNGDLLCNSCYNSQNSTGEEGSRDGTADTVRMPSSAAGNSASIVGSQFIGPIRKSARLKPSKHKYQIVAKPLATKGKSRRVIFKKNPIKAAPSVATVVSSDYIFHDGLYWQVGDIVSVMDHDGDVYYAQLRGFLQDQYSASSAVITWLLPTNRSTRNQFDPSTYILGPEEELPRPMECFEFICHAPSDYFRSRSQPYRTVPIKPEIGFISTRLESGYISAVPTQDELYGLSQDRHPHVTGRKEKRKDKSSPGKEKKEKTVKKEAKERGKNKSDKPVVESNA